MKFVIITGLSGAGKSNAVRAMEDLGFYCIDNMPPALISKFAEICMQSGGKIEKVALVIDLRGGYLFDELFSGLNELKNKGFDYDILFLDSSDEVLVKRYKESRRSHPLAVDGRITEGIDKERALLSEARSRAKYIIDTSNLKPSQLKNEIASIFIEGNEFKGIIVNVISFGFKYGIPIDADLIFDVRFLPNPFYIPSLKPKSGMNADVKDYVFSYPQTQKFLDKLKDMLTYLLPYYIEEGKNQLVVAIGCTGGRHRSVAIAEEIFKHLNSEGYHTLITHRDCIREG